MRKEDKKKLTINRRIIVNHLDDLEGVLDYLISKQIFTPSIRERVIYENKSDRKRPPYDQVRQSLDYLVTKNALSYQYFLEALILTNNTHIANILEPDYLSSEECKIMIQKEQIVLPSPTTSTANYRCHSASNTPEHTQINTHRLSYPNTCMQHYPTMPDFETFINTPNHVCAGSPLQAQLTPSQNKQLQLSMHYLKYQNPISHQFLMSNHMGSSTGNSRSSSQSMSPIMNRARSSSVTGFCNLRDTHNTKKNTNLKSRNRRVANSLIDEDCGYPVTVSNMDDNDLPSPMSNLYLNSMVNADMPPTYNIEWSDVNRLELDFVVHKTLPNIRKQLGPDECYHMENNPRGLCLIINNEHFYDNNGKELPKLRRYGTDMDASRLKNLFEKLRFRVEMHVDQTEREMRNRIVAFANDSDANSLEYDAICLILLSHGTDGYVYGVDFENRINLDSDILSLFDDVLIGKPKLFIFQACRGEHLNLKDSIQNPNSFITQSNSTSSLATHCTYGKPPHPARITPASSCSSMEDETTKKFKNLKVSSQQPSSIQMKYKKKMPVQSSNSSSATSSSTSISSSRMKTRSRSHSRSKYSAYLASAASAIKTACKTSPSTSKTRLLSISTQTSNPGSNSMQSLTSSQDESTIANCYPDTNIITSTSSNVSLMNFIDGRPIKTMLPSRSDFFIWYSSARGFVSHRDTDGSPFIKCLVTVFSRCAYDLELVEMVRKVNLLMQQYEKRHFEQERNAVASYFMVPVAEYHLAKKLYFNP